MKKSVLLILSLALLSLGHWAPEVEGQSSFQVIVNPGNPVSTLTKAQVSKFLLKKTTKWDSGGAVQAVDQGVAEAIRGVFTKEIHGRSVTSIQRYWQRQVFSGKDVPPPELGSDREVIDYVATNAGAIGYVTASASLGGVKAVSVSE